MAFGKDLQDFGSKLFAGPLSVVNLAFNGWNLGLTNGPSTLKPDADLKGIVYQQKGTKDYDHIITGCDWLLTASLAEIKTSLLTTILPYYFESSGSVGNDSGRITAKLGQSLLSTVAAPFKIAATVDQNPSEDPKDTMSFYLAIITVTGDLIQWGADVQRNVQIEVRFKPRRIATGESTSLVGKVYHGYWGDAAQEDLPAIVWPDYDAPYIVAANVLDAVTIELTMSENATAVAGTTQTEQIIAKVGNKYVVPTIVDYVANVVTVTLPATSISPGDLVSIYVTESTWEDTDNNENSEVSNFAVTNSL